MGELKLICHHLDRIICDYFVTQDEFYKVQAKLETLMKEGMLSMAKARYSMGVKAVSALQINMDDMQATQKVKVEPQDPEVDIDDPYMSLTMLTVDPDSESPDVESLDGESMEKESPKADSKETEGLRRRNVTEKEGKDTDEGKVDELASRVEAINLNKAKASPKKHDPLKWFGVLVPQALRVAQKQFKTAAELSCEAASLKAKLVHLQGTIRRLLRRKEDIIDSIDNSGFVIYDDSSFSTSAIIADNTNGDLSMST